VIAVLDYDMPKWPKIELTPLEKKVLDEIASILHKDPKHRHPVRTAAIRLNMTYVAVKSVLQRVRMRYLKAREFCQEYVYYRRRFHRRLLK